MRFERACCEAEVLDWIGCNNWAEDVQALDLETECAVQDCSNSKCEHALSPRTARIKDVVISAGPDTVVIFGGHLAHTLLKIKHPLILHNFKFDFKMLHAAGVDLRGHEVRDTMLLHHLLDENSPHALDVLVQAFYKDNYKEVFWEKYKRYEDASEPDQLQYACKDVYYTRRLYTDLCKRLAKAGIPNSLIENAHRLAQALLDTEIEGVRVDLDYLMQMGTQLKTDIVRTELELRQLGGWACEALELRYWRKAIDKAFKPKGKKWQTLPKPEFNFGASGQVCDLLYEALGLPEQHDEKTGNVTADDAALEELEALHPIVPRLRELRKFGKMYSSFIEGVLSKVSGGLIYPSFNVNGTKTGRISHSEPNMGQMPSKGEWVKIRGIFVPTSGHRIVGADYGQLEVCIAAHYSQDANLLKIINEGASQHDITAQSLGIPRPLAKTLNFGMQYLCSPFKVQQLLGCSKEEAEGVWRKYWETYGGLKAFIDSCIAKMEETGEVSTLFGRKRHFPGYKRPRWVDPEKGMYSKPMRQAFNAVIQGTGADFTSLAFAQIAEQFKRAGWGRAWFTVHDEVLTEVRPECAAEAQEYIERTMVGLGQTMGLTVPLKVEVSDPMDRWSKG